MGAVGENGGAGGNGSRLSRGWNQLPGGDSFQKIVITGLLSALLTGGGAWLTYVKDSPNSDDMAQLRNDMKELSKTVADLSTQVAVLGQAVKDSKR